MSLLSNMKKRLGKSETKYWDRTALDSTGALYRLAIGGRGNGKTYSWCRSILESYFDKKEQAAYIRRFAEELMPKNISGLFNPHYDYIKKKSKGKYNGVFYRAKEFRLCYYEDDGTLTAKDSTPFCITADLNTSMVTKGADRAPVTSILFDEFMTRNLYLKDEFILFQNLLSSLIRDRNNVIIYMFGNTVNRYCPYWEEMGLKGAAKIQQGEIQTYQYGDTGLSLALEYCPDVSDQRKDTSKYFAFDNPQIRMISSGAWEIALYNRCPYKLFDEDILKEFYVCFQGETIKGKVIRKENDYFLFFHQHTRDTKLKPTDIVYCDFAAPSQYWVYNALDAPTLVHKEIIRLLQRKKVFMSTNEVGEVVRNYFLKFGKFDIR